MTRYPTILIFKWCYLHTLIHTTSAYHLRFAYVQLTTCDLLHSMTCPLPITTSLLRLTNYHLPLITSISPYHLLFTLCHLPLSIYPLHPCYSPLSLTLTTYTLLFATYQCHILLATCTLALTASHLPLAIYHLPVAPCFLPLTT